MVYTFNPLKDPRWQGFVDRHAQGSVFHGAGWLEALSRTYGYEPVVYSTSPPSGELTNGVVLCRVNSWLTGRRLVSLPFTDHCEPLVQDAGDRMRVLRALAAEVDGNSSRPQLKYVELRPLSTNPWDDPAADRSESFAFHMLDLRPALDDIYGRIHKSTHQRKILRAERESLSYEAGSSDVLLTKFYRLLLLTRRRHQLPPQPVQWFRNLIACMGDQLTIRIASKDGEPLAAILTLSYRDTMTYKYGCSDARHHSLGAVPFVLWKAVQEGRALGMNQLDLGRSDRDNEGLITFKDRWGAERSQLTYVRYSRSRASQTTDHRQRRVLRQAFARLPDSMLVAAGKLLYRHMG
jgi:hypothetical protein